MIPKNLECKDCGREMKVHCECIAHPDDHGCYYCHLMHEHINLDGNLGNGKDITTKGPSLPPEGPTELPPKEVEVAA